MVSDNNMFSKETKQSIQRSLKKKEKAKNLQVQLQNGEITFSQYLRGLTDIQIDRIKKGEL